MSPIFQILTILILAVYAVMLFKSRLRGKFMIPAIAVIIITATGLYMYAYNIAGYDQSPLTNLLRSLVAALKLFVYDNDLSDIVDAQFKPLFLDFFFLTFYAAVLTSTSALIMLLGKRTLTMFLLLFRKKKFDHVFIGTNSRSMMVASGIQDQEIAFIEFPDESDGDPFSVSYIIKSMSGGDDDMNERKVRHIHVLRAKRKLTLRSKSYGVFHHMGLDRLAKLTDRDTSFYLLSEDYDRNLHDLLALVTDKSLHDNTIHACVKREGLAGQYQSVLDHTGVHFIYPSSLSVVGLMTAPICHPANAMARVHGADGKATGAVTGHFDAMIVGFGETGQAVLKFLYEFSSAVTPDRKPMPMTIYVSDSKMESIKGPYLFANPNFGQDDTIVFEKYGSENSIFWRNLRDRIDDINYIEISTGNDAYNLELAFKIYSYVEKYRKDQFLNFMMVVRKTYTPEHEVLLKNRLNEKAGRKVIVFYGELDKIFTPRMIISKSKSGSGINSAAVATAERMKNNFYAVTGKEIARNDADMTYEEKRRARRHTHQLISSANHIASKLIFTEGSRDVSGNTLENLAALEHLRYSRYLIARGYTYGSTDDDVRKISSQLCTWADLPEEKKQYHRDMVRASLSV